MRTPIVALLAAVLCMPGALPCGSAWARAEPTAEELYDYGRTAYRLGKFKDAVEAWEKSYELSKGNPLLLYNISLAYRGLYGISKDLQDLRKARAVLENFLRVAEADTALAGEIADAQARLAEIDQEIAEAERAAAEAAAAGRTDPGPGPDRGPTPEERRARKFRTAGAATMGAGGVVLLTGAALGVAFSVRSGQFAKELDQKKAEVILDTGDESCVSTANAGAALDYAHAVARMDPAAQAELADVPDGCSGSLQGMADVAQLRINGNKANRLTIISFTAFGAVGLAAIIAGAVVYAQGRGPKGSRRAARVQFSPTFGGRNGVGFAVQGRF